MRGLFHLMRAADVMVNLGDVHMQNRRFFLALQHRFA